MERRNFLIGMGSTAAGASALIGSGAFSRVESQRHVTVEVAEDPNAYLGLEPSGSANGENYAEVDDDSGHLEIDIGENPNDGHGVNSNSTTWFDCVFTVTNQGKEDATFYVEDMEGLGTEEGEVSFYTGEASGSNGDDNLDFIVGQDNEVDLDLGSGDSICVGIRVNSAEDQADPLFDDHVTLIADSPEAGATSD